MFSRQCSERNLDYMEVMNKVKKKYNDKLLQCRRSEISHLGVKLFHLLLLA